MALGVGVSPFVGRCAERFQMQVGCRGSPLWVRNRVRAHCVRVPGQALCPVHTHRKKAQGQHTHLCPSALQHCGNVPRSVQVCKTRLRLHPRQRAVHTAASTGSFTLTSWHGRRQLEKNAPAPTLSPPNWAPLPPFFPSSFMESSALIWARKLLTLLIQIY